MMVVNLLVPPAYAETPALPQLFLSRDDVADSRHRVELKYALGTLGVVSDPPPFHAGDLPGDFSLPDPSRLRQWHHSPHRRRGNLQWYHGLSCAAQPQRRHHADLDARASPRRAVSRHHRLPGRASGAVPSEHETVISHFPTVFDGRNAIYLAVCRRSHGHLGSWRPTRPSNGFPRLSAREDGFLLARLRFAAAGWCFPVHRGAGVGRLLIDHRLSGYGLDPALPPTPGHASLREGEPQEYADGVQRDQGRHAGLEDDDQHAGDQRQRHDAAGIHQPAAAERQLPRQKPSAAARAHSDEGTH